MSELLNISGAPGTGKTRLLLQQYVRACQIIGPERVLATTFTRAAADELRERCAIALGFSERGWSLRRRLPFVGTVHSLCLRLSGLDHNKLVDSRKLRDFDKRLENVKVPSIEYMDALIMDEPTRHSEDVEVALWVRAAALHRMVPLEDVWPLVDPQLSAQMSFPTIQRLVEAYETWKKARGYVDFEDLLLLGRSLLPPVRVVLADECQDNSPLLWSVINAWGQNPAVASFVCAGDAFQALYAFAGGDPRLFSSREGTWHVIRQSHRFDNTSASYARQLLVPAFGQDERFADLTNWEGIGGTGPQDDSAFWLARTNSLVGIKAAQLQQDGLPYGFIRGRAPLQTKAGDAYRSLLRAERGDMISKDDLAGIAGEFKTQAAKKAAAFIKTLPTGWYSSGTVEAAFGCSLRGVLAMLPYAPYFTRLRARFGDDVIFKTPSLLLGTVHAAKGKEAGSVVVCKNWATKPFANLKSTEGQRGEGCVAYVAVSRHKNSLKFETLREATGGVYNFPRQG